MLKRVFSIKSKESLSAHNALIKLDETDSAGKGRKFKSRFITPGLAGYPDQFGNVLIQKETFDKFINSMVGVPVVIRHKDLTQDNADEERVGVVSTVWFDDKDGWYWCDGIIWDETAINLITDKGWSVSCSYDVLEADDIGGTWNNTPYDMEFLNGIFTHLALVDNPRYEKANIVFNSKTILNNLLYENKKTGVSNRKASIALKVNNLSENIITRNDKDFNPKVKYIKEHEEMTLIDELKKLIQKVENDKGDSMKKARNEDVDKREILREADAIAMKPASDFKGGEEEKFRTLTKKLEELSYNKSERGTSDNEKDDDEKTDDVEKEKKADNESEKDEEEYEDYKREIKEEADNRKSCKNKANNAKHSYFDELNKVYNAPQKPKEENLYVSRDEKLKAAEEYFS